MPLAPEAVQTDRDLERNPESALAKESTILDTSASALGGVLSALGTDGSDDVNSRRLVSSPVMRHRANGEMRTLVMRRVQQGVGNHKTQQLVAQLRRSVVQRQCSCGGTCASCQSKSFEEEEQPKLLQRQAASRSTGDGAADVNVIPANSPGQPLDQGTRDFMESRFGNDFSEVRVHSDTSAAESADALSADAYTTGRDIYFAAGKYAPASQEGQHLLAHELTHTVQQANGAMPLATSRSGDVLIGDINDPLEGEAQRAADMVVGGRGSGPHISPDATAAVRREPDSPWDEIVHEAEATGDALEKGAKAAGSGFASAANAFGRGMAAGTRGVASGAQAVGSAVVRGAETAGEWLETKAGSLAKMLARSLGATVTVTSAGLEVTLPKVCPINAMPYSFNLPSIDKKFTAPIGGLPLGTVVITGAVGVVGHIRPKAQVQVGPVCLNGVRILINPATDTYSVSGSVSATAAASLSAELDGGLTGLLTLEGVIPIGGIPVPVTIPLLGLEGGLAGMFRAIGAGTLTMGQSLSFSAGTIAMSDSGQLALGLAGDLFLGAYAQLDIIGQNVCRIYWQPYEWHGDVAGSLGLSIGLTVVPGLPPTIIPKISLPTFDQIPFDQIPLVLSRKGFSEDCPMRDRICDILRMLNLLPSQNGGSWNWSGPYGPGSRLPGPLEVYQKNPGIPSGSECRGACGPNCDTCHPTLLYRYTDPVTGDIWEYTNYQDCNSNEGCREHDAAFDWAADVHGETGRWAIILPWHMAANIECTCNNLVGNCIAWIAGAPPYDSKMYFADAATLILPGGGGGTSTGSCHADYPNAPDCVASFPDRDTVLNRWGSENKISQFRDCEIAESWTAGGLIGCDGAPGNLWHCRATDVVTGQDVTVSITECICCKDDDTTDSEWRQPQIVVEPDMSEELILELCDRKLISRVICIPIEENMIARFGNRDRDLNIDPDKDPKARPRPDDAPIVDTFRRIYNRLDSWSIYIRTHHENLYPEFETKFQVELKREEWINDLKLRTKQYKEEFRNLQSTDPAQLQRDYEAYVLGNIQGEIEKKIREIAAWYRDKIDSMESIDEIIERVHEEGTELWRAAWRRAILQVNRVLSRLWPPAKTLILVWVGEQRAKFPHVDLSGSVGELDYIGSLATGYKGPPKQQIRFNPDSFDVDANLVAPPLAKYALAVDPKKPRPDRKRIFGRATNIAPLNDFSNQAHTELSARVQGYNSSDLFDVAIESVELPEQQRERVATERLYKLRTSLDATTYKKMLDELNAGGYLSSGGEAVRADLTDAQFKEMNAIMDRYEP